MTFLWCAIAFVAGVAAGALGFRFAQRAVWKLQEQARNDMLAFINRHSAILSASAEKPTPPRPPGGGAAGLN